MGDETMLLRAMMNLMDNALAHHRAAGADRVIRIEASRAAEGVRLAVLDNGPGIAPEHLARIWDRFYRADPARASADGAGLGLSMVQWIAQKHGGRAAVQSEPGRGSAFELLLPAEDPAQGGR